MADVRVLQAGGMYTMCSMDGYNDGCVWVWVNPLSIAPLETIISHVVYPPVAVQVYHEIAWFHCIVGWTLLCCMCWGWLAQESLSTFAPHAGGRKIGGGGKGMAGGGGMALP